MTPFFRNHFKIYKEDTYVNHFRHVLSSDQYLPTGGTNKDIIIINIYRPPNDIQQHYKTFIDEFAKLI